MAALGGNALLERGEPADSDIQQAHVVRAARALAVIASQHELVITHGNGPQVGMLALESAADSALAHPYPLDVLGAQTQGMIGYWLVQALTNARRGVRPPRDIACLVSRTLVDVSDQAFANPTKFIGPGYDEDLASEMAARHGYHMRPDGKRWRRVVPSPEPVGLIDLPLISRLIESGAIVICAGGGGIPVVRDQSGELRGVDAVVDKDLAAALLAEAIHADVLLLLTDVEAVMDGYGTAAAAALRLVSVADLRARSFPPGSMGPKVEAACRFVARTQGTAAIGRLTEASGLLAGTAGTVITR